MNRYKNLVKFATFKEQNETTYALSKALTKNTNKADFKHYCDFFNLDFEDEAQRVQKKFGCKFSWYGEKVDFN